MSNRSIKMYKNSGRNESEVHKKYVPQYQIMGVEPEEFKSAVVTENVLIAKESSHTAITNPRIHKSSIRQPYAKITPSPVGRGRGPVPNIGNNMEHTWSSVDGEIINDISEEVVINHEMIDNNEFMTNNALGINDQNSSEEIKSFMSEKDLQDVMEEGDISNIINSYNIKDDEYILLINGIVFSIGSFDFIQNETKSLIFGEHDVCNNSPIPMEDILVLKKIKLKIGVFLE